MSLLHRSLVALVVIGLAAGCAPSPADAEDATTSATADDAGAPLDGVDDGAQGSPLDAGAPGEADDAGPAIEGDDLDAGASEPDAGEPFSWSDVFDGGLPEELSCLPGALPDLSLAGLFDAVAFSPYSGAKEPGVRCGDTVCAPGISCCLLCGFAACAEPESDGGEPSCPAFTRPISCDGPEDCGGDDDTCCYTLSGAECRPASECGVDLTMPSLDGGFSWAVDEDAGPEDDAGPAEDGGLPDDAGQPSDAGAASEADFAGFLEQGFEVCTTSLPFFGECDLLAGELCCTSERFVAIDLGLCIPAALCLGSALP